MAEPFGRSITSLVRRPFDALAGVDKRYLKGVFFVGIFAYTLLLVLEARDYSANARLFPILIGVSVLLMVVVQIALLGLSERLNFGGGGLVASMMERGIGGETIGIDDENDRLEPAVKYQRELLMIIWTVALLGFLWVFGFIVTIVVFIFSFVYFYERDVKRAVLATVLAYAMIDILFIRLLQARLWDGVVPLVTAGIL